MNVFNCHIRLLTLWVLVFFCAYNANAQRVALKSNAAYWAAGASPNVQFELALNKKMTLELGGGVNFWTFSDNKKIKHWLLQPELRYWFCDVFNGHFVGLHGHGGEVNIGGWDIPIGRLETLKDERHEGYFYGVGASYGYQWILSPRWNLEMSLGGGWARIHYRKYDCATCGAFKSEGVHDYFGVTRVSLSMIYFID